jgi:hypothetical protein
MKFICRLILSLTFLFSAPLFAQDEDLLSLLGNEDSLTTEYARAAFKASRVINSHSLENVAAGVLDFRISHRFGVLNNGLYDIFGLDNATIRFGLDYGITPRLMVGVGRNSYEKTYDGFLKYKILRQSKGKRNMPVTLALAAGMSINTLKWANPDRENYFTSRLSYYYQVILGRKFSESFSLQVMPTLVHRNLVETTADKNDIISIGIAARQKLSKRIAINAEYFYVLPNQIITNTYYNSLSVGMDIETGGHVFQLHFTNSTAMFEKGFVAGTTNDWFDGGIHFGFNVSRVFTIAQPKNREH